MVSFSFFAFSLIIFEYIKQFWFKLGNTTQAWWNFTDFGSLDRQDLWLGWTKHRTCTKYNWNLCWLFDPVLLLPSFYTSFHKSPKTCEGAQFSDWCCCWPFCVVSLNKLIMKGEKGIFFIVRNYSFQLYKYASINMRYVQWTTYYFITNHIFHAFYVKISA